MFLPLCGQRHKHNNVPHTHTHTTTLAHTCARKQVVDLITKHGGSNATVGQLWSAIRAFCKGNEKTYSEAYYPQKFHKATRKNPPPPPPAPPLYPHVVAALTGQKLSPPKKPASPKAGQH